MSLLIKCDGEDCNNLSGYNCTSVYPLTPKAQYIIKEYTRETINHLCDECIELYNDSIEEGILTIIDDEIIDFKVEEC